MTDGIQVSQNRTLFAVAKSVQLACPLCGYMVEAVFPWGSTNEDKMRIRHDVITEHTKVCSVGGAEVLRVWDVETPRA